MNFSMAFCCKCGRQLTVGDNFCPGCGTRVNERAAGTPAPPPAAPPPMYYAPPPAPVPAALPKTKIPRPLFPQGSKIPMAAGIAMTAAWLLTMVNAITVYGVFVSPLYGHLLPILLITAVPCLLFGMFAFTEAKKRPVLFLIPLVLDIAITLVIDKHRTFFLNFNFRYPYWIWLLWIVSAALYGLALSGKVKNQPERAALACAALAVTFVVPWVWFFSQRTLPQGQLDGVRAILPDLMRLLAYALAAVGLKNAPKGDAHGPSA